MIWNDLKFTNFLKIIVHINTKTHYENFLGHTNLCVGLLVIMDLNFFVHDNQSYFDT
jgi:hypothetical protein